MILLKGNISQNNDNNNLLTRIMKVRSISVILSNIEDNSNQQIRLFDRRKLGFVMDGKETNTNRKRS